MIAVKVPHYLAIVPAHVGFYYGILHGNFAEFEPLTVFDVIIQQAP